MTLALIVYLFIGIMSNFLGPLAKEVDNMILKYKSQHLANILLGKPSTAPKWKRASFEIVIRLIVVILYPVLYVLMAVDYFRT
jgi:hypothetical protein